jgi:hypothetical protein
VLFFYVQKLGCQTYILLVGSWSVVDMVNMLIYQSVWVVKLNLVFSSEDASTFI